MLVSSLLLALSLHNAVLPPSSAAEAVRPPEASTCELHYWPAERLEGLAFSVYNGLIRGRASENQIEGAMNDFLSPSSQVAALRDANLASEMGLPAGTKLIEHQEPLDRKTLNRIKTRRTQSASLCYSELIIMQHVLVEDIVWGDRFISTFMFRDFGDKPELRQTVKGSGGNRLKVLTQTENTRPADAPQLVAAAIRANFVEYAKNARPKVTAGLRAQ